MSKEAVKSPKIQIVRHPDHVCYCDRISGEMVRTESPTPASFEFFVEDSGVVLLRRPAAEQGSEHQASVMCMTGAFNIEHFCSKHGCKVPESTARASAQLSPVASSSRAGGTMKEDKVKSKSAKSKSVVEVWNDIFVKNEKDKQTDEQLVVEFKKHFPDARNPRPAMYRTFYNEGSYSFQKLGSAESRKLPISHRYDGDGNVIEKGKKVSLKDEADESNRIDKIVKRNKEKNSKRLKSPKLKISTKVKTRRKSK